MIGIIILNYITWQDAADCVSSVRRSCCLPYMIYIVDNASPNDSAENLMNMFSGDGDVEIILSGENRGYSAGNNIGIRKALLDGCSQILISNSDVLFHEGSIEAMSNFLNYTDDAGLVGPKTYNRKGEAYYVIRRNVEKDTILLALSFLGRTFIGRKAREYYFCNDLSHDKTIQVDILQGCCLFFKRELLEQIDLFDEGTFLFTEEPILAKRISYTNYKTYYMPEASITHMGGSSISNASVNWLYYQTVGQIYFCKAYLDASVAWCCLFVFLTWIECAGYAVKYRYKLSFITKYVLMTIREPFKKVEKYKHNTRF